jgi:hypothetical protein
MPAESTNGSLSAATLPSLEFHNVAICVLIQVYLTFPEGRYNTNMEEKNDPAVQSPSQISTSIWNRRSRFSLWLLNSVKSTSVHYQSLQQLWTNLSEFMTQGSSIPQVNSNTCNFHVVRESVWTAFKTIQTPNDLDDFFKTLPSFIVEPSNIDEDENKRHCLLSNSVFGIYITTYDNII